MIAIDTNVLVRVFVKDHEAQYRRVARLLEKETVFISKTVLLEAEWVLRRGYGFTTGQLLIAFGDLLNTVNVEVEEQTVVAQALEWLERGLDFADALHLASRGEKTQFVTFDEQLIRRAARIGIQDVRRI